MNNTPTPVPPHVNGTRRLGLNSKAHAYLQAMTKTGLYGATVEEVIHSLILAGVRDAVERGFVKLPKDRKSA